MTRLPPEDLLSGDVLIESPNTTLVASLLEALTPANMNTIYVAAASGNRSAFLDIDDKNVKTLPHYGVKYLVQDFEKEFPHAAKRWNEWINGASPDLESRLPKSLLTSGSAVPIIPAAIEGVPTEIPLQHMHAQKSKAKADPDAALYGARPKKVES